MSKPMDPEADPPVKAIGTCLRIVETLKDLDGAGVSEIARHLDLPKSTVHDHIRTLEQCGYVTAGEGGEYRNGARFLEIGGHARSKMRIYHVAGPEIRKLADETGEIANLMIEQHGQGFFLLVIEGGDAPRIGNVHHTGNRVHLHTTALGKSILAELPEERVEAIVERHGLPQATENSIADRAELFEELEAVRERGYAIDDEERVEGMRCIAAPISTEETNAAISVSAPTTRMQGERFETELPERVLRAANVIEVNMEYQ